MPPMNLDAYEQRELQRFRGEVAEKERGTLAERRESTREFLAAITDDPELVVERIHWMLHGNYGQGAALAAHQVAENPRMNRAAWLSQTIGALEWGAPPSMVRRTVGTLTQTALTQLTRMIQQLVEHYLKEDPLGYVERGRARRSSRSSVVGGRSLNGAGRDPERHRLPPRWSPKTIERHTMRVRAAQSVIARARREGKKAPDWALADVAAAEHPRGTAGYFHEPEETRRALRERHRDLHRHRRSSSQGPTTDNRQLRSSSRKPTTDNRRLRSSSSRLGFPPYPRGREKLERVLHEYQAGTLRSAAGYPVRSRRQAVAIGLAEQRRSERRRSRDPQSGTGLSPEARWYRRKYGLTDSEARHFADLYDHQQVDREIETWRERNGFPSPMSPLVRGLVIEKLRTSPRKPRRGRKS